MVTDLGPGDGGKGGVVHKIAHMQHAHTIVKVGGAQGSHGVRTANGKTFAFSQFGCGTLEGVRTHISPRFITDPIALMTEAKLLQKEGVANPLSLMTVDERSLCSTVFHMAASQLSELLLKDNPRGTIGSGVGQAYRLNESNPELSVFVRDLSQADLRDRLAAIQMHYRNRFAEVLRDLDQFKMIDLKHVCEAQSLLMKDVYVDSATELMQEFATYVTITSADYFARRVLGRDGVVVSESSHGILTDKYTGFHPHTSAIRTLPAFTRGMYEDAGYDGEIVSLGIHRAYQIRHGAGPMVTHDSSMSEALLPGSNKNENRWQGKVRVGPVDLVSLRYALAASGEGAYDALAITWFDQIQKLGSWQYCNRYTGADDSRFFMPSGGIRVRKGEDESQLQHLGALTKQLQACSPEVTTVPLDPGASRNELYTLCADTLLDHLGVPVRMISFGPTEQDKMTQ